ncbi:hypothetical protein [Desulfatirhabdium butyrativorans]|uniref:hypothetical protein n=1 Tax=Desulfatirhabdium butyrativorans TaxID=340467 RepID=UPI000405D7F6|nr:hypothetical protein [Desulfatirhabdium butyrativorans]
MTFSESIIEQAAFGWLADFGYQTLFGPDITPDMPAAEHDNYGQVVLEYRLRQALTRINPHVPAGYAGRNLPLRENEKNYKEGSTLLIPL